MKQIIKYKLLLLLSCFVWLPSLATIQNHVGTDNLIDTSKSNYKLSSAHFQQNLFVEDVSHFNFSSQNLPDYEHDDLLGYPLFHTYEVANISLFKFSKKSTHTEDRRKRILQFIYPFHFFF